MPTAITGHLTDAVTPRPRRPLPPSSTTERLTRWTPQRLPHGRSGPARSLDETGTYEEVLMDDAHCEVTGTGRPTIERVHYGLVLDALSCRVPW